jgi:hypothetical protein
MITPITMNRAGVRKRSHPAAPQRQFQRTLNMMCCHARVRRASLLAADALSTQPASAGLRSAFAPDSSRNTTNTMHAAPALGAGGWLHGRSV